METIKLSPSHAALVRRLLARMDGLDFGSLTVTFRDGVAQKIERLDVAAGRPSHPLNIVEDVEDAA